MSEDVTRSQHVGRLVRAALVEHGRTQNDVADLLGLTYAAVSRRVLGHVSFRADELMQIGEFLGVSTSRFVRPVPQPRSAERPAAHDGAEDDIDGDKEAERAVELALRVTPRAGAA